MINITNGVNHMTTTRGAFNEIFAPQGWVEVEEVIEIKNDFAEDANQDPNQEGEEFDNEDDLDEDLDESGESDDESDDEDEDDFDEDDLEERPLSELSYEELQKLAKIKGANTTGLRSKKEIRDMLKAL